MTEVVDTDKLVADFVALRDHLSTLTSDYEAQKRKIKAAQERIGGLLLKHLNDHKQESVRTAHGTFFKTEEITPTAADWDAFYKWIAKTDGFEFLEKRIKRTEIKKYMEDHDGTPPPGISTLREYVVNVRRKD